MKKIALILVFALVTMALASCGAGKPNDDTDLKIEDLLENKDEEGNEEKPNVSVKYDCVYENYTYDLYVDDNYIVITKYDFGTDEEAAGDAATAAEDEEVIETIDLTIPATIDGVPVKKIAKGAFEKNNVLASVTVPAGVTEIAAEAFWFSTSLTSVKLPASLTLLGERVFAYCPALTALDVPASVTEIPAGLCIECTALEKLTFGNKVTSIGENAFAFCTALKTVNLGTSLTTIGAGAFKWCTALTKADLPASSKDVAADAFAHCDLLGK